MGVAFTPGMNSSIARRIEENDLPLSDFFEMPTSELLASLSLGEGIRLDKVRREEALFRARKEMEFVERHAIRPLYFSDERYPMLLREAPDAPVMLFQLGDTDLNSPHIMNIVGTRRASPYASTFCNGFIPDMAAYFPDLLIVSGLAFGVDSLAHKGAIENGLNTVAVVAHGLDTLYPAANRDLARRILKSGGSIVSEYPSGTTPFQKRFLERNRIVAGMSELTLVVESPIKGGAMSTANIAFSYSRDVAAVPGRVTDAMSEGCNFLIRKQKASLLTSAADVVELMGWRPAGIKVKPRQRNLFPELSGEGAEIYGQLKNHVSPLTLDEIHSATHISVPSLMALLTELEFDGVVVRLPGNRYSVP